MAIEQIIPQIIIRIRHKWRY